ncbi:P-loop containing nucleoside triphosphate hydrolase protein [Rhizoctonia solani]|nr:P-loop containing nucleoside triphosphate hydrolase protein [Rhizoctonia solani]
MLARSCSNDWHNTLALRPGLGHAVTPIVTIDSDRVPHVIASVIVWSLDLSEISRKALEVLGFMPCQFQVDICDLQLRGEHSVLVSPTGSGKSLAFLLPFLWQKSGVCIVLFKDIATGVYQLVIASPEYIEQDHRFRKYLWNSTNFRNQVVRVVFDEAHCVLEWGQFRPAYHRLSFLCPLLLHATFLALLATLSPAMVTELQRLLGLTAISVIRRSNDRHNIVPVVRAIKYPLNTLHNLAFLIPLGFNANSPPPPKFMVFMHSKKLCQEGAKFLRARLPLELQERVVWVHADMSREFNEEAMLALRNGGLYGIVCTDVAGMGIDIPDIDLVVQHQPPSKYCSVSQHFGRAARDPSHTAKAILLVDSKYFDDVKQKSQERSHKIQASKAAKKRSAEVSLDSPGLKRLRVTSNSEISLPKANKEGISMKTKEPDNETVADPLFATMEELPKSTRTRAPTTLPSGDTAEWTDADEGLEEALDIWREEKANSLWGPMHIVGGGGIISDKQIERIVQLARRQLISTLSDFQQELRWLFMASYGAEVLAVVHSSHPPLISELPPNSSTVNMPGLAPVENSQSKPRMVHCSACLRAGHSGIGHNST